MADKPSIAFYNESVKKWEDGLETLKSTPLSPKSLKEWFDNTICGDCGFCKAYNKNCAKCPLIFALVCCRISDNRVLLWQIGEAACKGDKAEAIGKTSELITKIKSLKELFA